VITFVWVHNLWRVAMIDPWEKAAECEREIKSCPDLSRRCVLENLRQLWVAIGKDKSVGTSEWQGHAADADKLHADVMRATEC